MALPLFVHAPYFVQCKLLRLAGQGEQQDAAPVIRFAISVFRIDRPSVAPVVRTTCSLCFPSAGHVRTARSGWLFGWLPPTMTGPPAIIKVKVTH